MDVWKSALSGADGFHEVLQKSGISERLILSDAVGYMGIGLWGSGRWVPKSNADRAVVIAASSVAGEYLDLVAFRPQSPRSFWRYSGEADVLGGYFIERARAINEPLAVYETPLDWLRGSLPGVVFLDLQRSWARELSGIPKLRCFSVDFARRIKATLERPLPIPDIEVAT